MIRIRPYMPSDGDSILSWCRDERGFYQWTAGIIGEYPPTAERFDSLGRLMRFTAIDEKLQEELLQVAYQYIKQGKVDGIRISTRPDAINKEILKRLKKQRIQYYEYQYKRSSI